MASSDVGITERSPERGRSNAKYRLLLALFAVILLLVYWIFPSEPTPAPVRLSDGSTLSVQKIDFGRKHVLRLGSPLGRILTLFSTKVAGRFGGGKVVLTNATETLLVLFEQRNLAAVSPIMVRVVDESGLESSGTPCIGLSSGTTNRWLYHATLENFPRRQPSFRLRIYDQVRGGTAWGSFTNIAEFKVMRPVRRNYPEWEPVAVPAVARDGREQVTLARFNTGLYATGVLVQSFSRSWTELAFRWNTNGSDNGPWIIKDVEISDSTGNRLGGSYGKIFRQDNKQVWMANSSGWANLPAYLWMDEPAWKVRATFLQVRPSNFREESLWRIHGIPVPASNTYVALNLSTQLFGAKLELQGIAGAGGRLPSERTGPDSHPRVLVAFHPPNRQFEFSLLKVVDQRGVELKPRPRYLGDQVFPIPVDDESKYLDFILAVHQPRTFEFVVKPALLITNIAALQADPTTNEPPKMDAGPRSARP
jgi:hypothetical protein